MLGLGRRNFLAIPNTEKLTQREKTLSHDCTADLEP